LIFKTVLKNKKERKQSALKELEIVDETGRADMTDPHSVQKVAHEEKLNDLLVYLGPNPSRRNRDNFQKLIDEYDA
jgi:hypothetical protein